MFAAVAAGRCLLQSGARKDGTAERPLKLLQNRAEAAGPALLLIVHSVRQFDHLAAGAVCSPWGATSTKQRGFRRRLQRLHKKQLSHGLKHWRPCSL